MNIQKNCNGNDIVKIIESAIKSPTELIRKFFFEYLGSQLVGLILKSDFVFWVSIKSIAELRFVKSIKLMEPSPFNSWELPKITNNCISFQTPNRKYFNWCNKKANSLFCRIDFVCGTIAPWTSAERNLWVVCQKTFFRFDERFFWNFSVYYCIVVEKEILFMNFSEAANKNQWNTPIIPK